MPHGKCLFERVAHRVTRFTGSSRAIALAVGTEDRHEEKQRGKLRE